MSAVVVGYVPRPEGRAALEYGIKEARSRGGRLVVVNATRGDALVDSRYVQGAELDDLRAELEALDLPTELRSLSLGKDIAEELNEIAEEVDAAFIVIGLRHRTTVGKLIMGSAASRIMLTARKPVVAVKA